MIAKLIPNRVRRSYLGSSRIDAFCGDGGNDLSCGRAVGASYLVGAFPRNARSPRLVRPTHPRCEGLQRERGLVDAK